MHKKQIQKFSKHYFLVKTIFSVYVKKRTLREALFQNML